MNATCGGFFAEADAALAARRRHQEARTLWPSRSSGNWPVCTENLNPDVMVMKSAKDRVP
jgi:hypothetical protein